MAPDVKSLSWERSESTGSSVQGSTRRRLSDVFDKEKKNRCNVVSKTSPLREMRQYSLTKIRLPRYSPTRRALRSGAEKIARTFQQLRLSVDTISQRLKGPTRRRCRLENVDTPMATPRTRSRTILGRTPTRLYSPFGIDTPKKHCDASTPPRRSMRGRRTLQQYEENENEKPNTRCVIQTRAMVCQPSPTCNSLIE